MRWRQWTTATLEIARCAQPDSSFLTYLRCGTTNHESASLRIRSPLPLHLLPWSHVSDHPTRCPGHWRRNPLSLMRPESVVGSQSKALLLEMEMNQYLFGLAIRYICLGNHCAGTVHRIVPIETNPRVLQCPFCNPRNNLPGYYLRWIT